MNQIILLGRLVVDPEVRYSQGERSMAIARYRLAVDRKGRQDPDGLDADFLSIVAFDRHGEFAEKYFRKGMRVLVRGRVRASSYKNRDGVNIPTFEVYVEEQDFADGKDAGNSVGANQGGFSAGTSTAQNYGTSASQKRNDSSSGHAARGRNSQRGYSGSVNGDGFMNVPDGIGDEGMPF